MVKPIIYIFFFPLSALRYSFNALLKRSRIPDSSSYTLFFQPWYDVIIVFCLHWHKYVSWLRFHVHFVCLHWDLVMCNMGFPTQWPVCSASTAGSLGECRQICASPYPSDTRFDHLCLLLIRLALGFKPTVAFGARADTNCLKARNVIKCRYTPKSNTVHFRLGCWLQVFSKVSTECWSSISFLTFANHGSLSGVTYFLLLMQFFA